MKKKKWAKLIERDHYLHNPRLVGEQLRYAAEVDVHWLALLSWSGAAYHIAGHDRWIGWSDLQRRNRLHFVVSNSRFALNRGRWSIENKLHLPRDTTYREDHSRIRKHRVACSLASLKNLAIGLHALGVFNRRKSPCKTIPWKNNLLCRTE